VAVGIRLASGVVEGYEHRDPVEFMP